MKCWPYWSRGGYTLYRFERGDVHITINEGSLPTVCIAQWPHGWFFYLAVAPRVRVYFWLRTERFLRLLRSRL